MWRTYHTGLLCRRQQWTDAYLVLTGAIIGFYKSGAAARKVTNGLLRYVMMSYSCTLHVTSAVDLSLLHE